ncbi:MAG: hypothetical protein NTU43_01270 [Bacteroidetes bacterium]|nr:hypothetical protein [Bacteroidota bacterium]
MRLKDNLFIILICVSITCKAQFKKQFLLGAGGQFDRYSITTKYTSPFGNSPSGQRTVTNYGFGLEMGYYIFKNLSCSYKLTYQNYNSNLEYTTSVLNGLMIEKIFQLQDNIYFNIGAMPFYEKIYEKKYYLLDVIETNNQGSIFTVGFSFVLDKNIILGTHIFRKFNAFTDENGYSSLAGFSISAKYIFKKDLFKSNK